MIKLIYGIPVMFVIYIRHGINPFSKWKTAKDKVKSRLTSREKNFIIGLVPKEKTEFIDYLKHCFYGTDE